MNTASISDDTVRCPLHHACFDLHTGEASRPPAFDPIARWRVEQREDKIFVRERLESTRPGSITSYEFGAARRPNHGLAYAWIRGALALGVPKDDYDATLFKLGMIAGKIGIANLDTSERLAASLADAIAIRIGEPAGQTDPLLTQRRAW